MVGRVTSSAAAGPTPRPKDIMVCTIGISAAVRIMNNVPATAKPIITQKCHISLIFLRQLFYNLEGGIMN